MRIGEVAARTGLSPDTLRFYEKIGLIAPPSRDAGGRRNYGPDVIGWIGFLGQLNATGMKQADRVRYARLRARGPETVTERRVMLEAHRETLCDRIAMLTETLSLMDRKIADYRIQERETPHG